MDRTDALTEHELIERLRRESRLLRAIANAVLHDEHLADDVVQDTFQRALQQPRRGRIVRAWLATVTRNLAFDRRRAETRRISRESAAAQAETAETRQSYRAVTLAVLALEEPYRRTILSRYFDGEKPNEIAVRDKVPLATVKSRLQRGLQQLRAALLHEFGDDENSMLRGLALLTAPKGLFEVLVAGGIAMSFVGKFTVTAAVVALTSVLICRMQRGVDPLVPAAHVVKGESADPAPSALSPQPAPMIAREEVVAAPAAIQTATLDAPATIRGRIELPTGAPAAGSKVKLRGAPGNQERVIEFGNPKDWSDQETTTDAEGRFELRFVPPRAFQFFLDVVTVHEAKISWRWSAIDPGVRKDVETSRLPPAGAIEGKIVNREGELPKGHWLVYAESQFRTSGDGGDWARDYVAANPVTGEFRFDAFPIGTTRLYASSIDRDGSKRTTEIELEIQASKTVQRDLSYTEPLGEERRIRVDVSCALLDAFAKPAPGSLVLHGLEGGPRIASKDGRHASQWKFEDVPAGEYTLTFQDPAFEPWKKSGVKPGQTVDLVMVGAAGIAITVTTDNGIPIEKYRLLGRVEDATFSPNSFELHATDAPVPADATFRGLVPHTYEFTIEADGFARSRSRVPDLKAGELRSVKFSMRKGALISGRVMQAGSPRAGVRVVLDDRQETTPKPTLAIGNDPHRHEIMSDDDGRFEFGPLTPGRYELEAAVNPEESTERQVVAITDDQKNISLDLVLPRVGRLLGALVTTAQSNPATPLRLPGLRVAIISKRNAMAMSSMEFLKSGAEVVDTAVDEAGRFHFDALPEGPCEVWLRLPEIVLSTLEELGIVSQSPDPIRIGDVVIDPDAELTREFDLRKNAPGALTLDVAVDGRPAANAFAWLVSVPDAKGRSTTFGSTALDLTGHGRIGPASECEGRLIVRAADGSWIASASDSARVIAGSDRTMRVDLAPVDAEIVVLDARTRRPLAGWSAAIRIGGRIERPSTLDDSGVLRLRLGSGEYRLVTHENGTNWSNTRSARFAFSPPNGNRVEVMIE